MILFMFMLSIHSLIDEQEEEEEEKKKKK